MKPAESEAPVEAPAGMPELMVKAFSGVDRMKVVIQLDRMVVTAETARKIIAALVEERSP